MELVGQESTPGVTLSKVPSVKQLCEQLGFQHASLKDSTKFMDSTHAWRKTSTTSDGSPTTALLDWKSRSVQKELRLSATKFLEHNDNGRCFWSPTRSWAQPSDLHYPEHRDRIVDLLVQLFWKQNRYFRNNSYYNSKATDSFSCDGSVDQPTPTREIHERAAIPSPTASFRIPKKESENKRPIVTKPARAINAHRFRKEEREPRDDVVANDTREVDIFDVLDSSDDDDSEVITPALITKKVRNERPDHESGFRKRKRLHVEESPRRTERKRNPRTLPGVAPQEEVNMILDMEEGEDGANSSPASIGLEVHKVNPALGGLPRAYIPTAGRPAQATSNQNNLPNDLYSAPTAPMVSMQQHTASKPYRSTDQPAPTRLIRLKMQLSDQFPQTSKTPLPDHTAGGRSTTSQINMQNTISSGDISSGLKRSDASSPTECEPTTSIPVEYSRESESISSGNNRNTISLGSVISSHAEPKPPCVTIQHVTPEASVSTQNLPRTKTPVSRPKIQIQFFIVTREPLYTEEQWDDGKLQGVSLAAFLEGITIVTQRSHIEKIKLTLRTPFSNTILTVHSDAEDAWTIAKATFAEKLKESRLEGRARRIDDIGGYKILIEPFYQQVIVVKGDLEADDDLFEY